MVKNEFHEGHLGSQRMKALARSYVWWPNMDAELEPLQLDVIPVLYTHANHKKTAVHPWPWPIRSRLRRTGQRSNVIGTH